jgi:hypothetical protein
MFASGFSVVAQVAFTFIAAAASAQGPVATLSSKALNFRNVVYLSGAGAQFPANTKLTLSNTGSAPLEIDSIEAMSAPNGYPDLFIPQLSEADDCGRSLAPSASCTITVYLEEFAGGNPPCCLIVNDNAPDSPQIVPVGMFSPNFGERPLFTQSAPQIETITNDTNAPASIAPTTSSPEFALSNLCPPSLESGMSCTVEVTYTPLSVGYAGGFVSISVNASNAAGLASVFRGKALPHSRS